MTGSTGDREELMRRLITLISAGRNRTIVIRRELPRTSGASSGAKPYRIKVRRVLLSVSSLSVTDAACKATFLRQHFAAAVVVRVLRQSPT